MRHTDGQIPQGRSGGSNGIQESDCRLRGWRSRKPCLPLLSRRRGWLEPDRTHLSASERWVEARTSRDGGDIFRSISRHSDAIGDVHVQFIGGLSVARRVPRPIPSNGVAGADWSGRGASGPVRHRWRWNRGYRVVAKRGSLLQGRQCLGRSGFSASGSTRAGTLIAQKVTRTGALGGHDASNGTGGEHSCRPAAIPVGQVPDSTPKGHRSNDERRARTTGRRGARYATSWQRSLRHGRPATPTCSGGSSARTPCTATARENQSMDEKPSWPTLPE